jgi:cell division protein FtsI/penicillin-binding protein 2
LEITPSKLDANLDSVIDELSKLVDIEPRDRRRFMHLIKDSKPFASVPIRVRLTDEEVARFTAERFRFPGVEVQARLFRQYPLGEVASHVIGYISRINQREAQALCLRPLVRELQGPHVVAAVALATSLPGAPRPTAAACRRLGAAIGLSNLA